jgi:hypothetical protein
MMMIHNRISPTYGLSLMLGLLRCPEAGRHLLIGVATKLRIHDLARQTEQVRLYTTWSNVHMPLHTKGHGKYIPGQGISCMMGCATPALRI